MPGLRRNRRDSASANAAAERWLAATPFGVPVEPEVKMIQASSEGSGAVASGVADARPVARLGCGATGWKIGVTEPSLAVKAPFAPTMPATPASPKTRAARSSGSSASTGT